MFFKYKSKLFVYLILVSEFELDPSSCQVVFFGLKEQLVLNFRTNVATFQITREEYG